MNTEVIDLKPQVLSIAAMDVQVIQKNIKNVHLSVYPPNGQVKVSAPTAMHVDTIRAFVISQWGWIKRQQQKIRAQQREAPREYLDRESHYFNGRRYLLKIIEKNAAPQVHLAHSRIILQIRPGAAQARRQAVMEEWYRQQLKTALRPIVARWENKLAVSARQYTIRKMKTKWGSCSPTTARICINLELMKKPPECLEYIVVHELVHLLESTHNRRFIALMDQFLPKWPFYRDELNALPVRHEEWKYC